MPNDPVFMFRRGLHNSDDERLAHFKALAKRDLAKGYNDNFTLLYEALSILDAKASSLLTFNAVGLTALAIWLERIPLNFFHLTLDVAFLCFLLSCGLCLKIVWLHWSSTEDLTNTDQYPVGLLEVRDSRTVLYRWAWLLAVCAVLVTSLATISHTLETLFTVYYDWKWDLVSDAATMSSPGF